MTPDEQRAYAEHLILEHARDVEYLSVHEMYEEFAVDRGYDNHAELSDAEAGAVHDLIGLAAITITWPPRDGAT